MAQFCATFVYFLIMKVIKALPKRVFDANFSNEYFISHPQAAFISIISCNSTDFKYDATIDNFIQVKMYDIEEDVKKVDLNGNITNYEKPSDEELQKIVDFCNKHANKSVFIIHCDAGISRSGAVAIYLRDKFSNEVDYKKFSKDNEYICPNLYVLCRLKKIDNLEIKSSYNNLW